jgi:two-component system cell cycle sensor histidine kinase/response regulator CckA
MEVQSMSSRKTYPFAPTPGVRASVVAEEARLAKPILLVDDDPIILELASTVLKLAGYDVVSASCGAQAWDIAQEDRRLDLVLSDVVMPGMNGVQLCEKLMGLRPKLKCILMSGYDMGLVASDRGAHFLPKPFFPHDLLGKVGEVLALQTS